MARPCCDLCKYFRNETPPRCIAESPDLSGRELLPESIFPCRCYTSIDEPDDLEGDGDGD